MIIRIGQKQFFNLIKTLKQNQFRLTDLGSITPAFNTSSLKKRTSSSPSGNSIYPIPLNNIKKRDVSPQPTEKFLVVPEMLPPSNSSDIPIIKVNGESTTSYFIKQDSPEMERKNILIAIRKGIRSKSRDIMKMVYAPNEEGSENVEKVINQVMDDFVSSLDGSAKFWIGKDYVNFIVKDFTNLEAPFDDFIDRTTTPRMPWHDVAVCVQNATAKDVARHFIERWNATKFEKLRFNHSYPYLLPKSYIDCISKPSFLISDTYKITCQVNFCHSVAQVI